MNTKPQIVTVSRVAELCSVSQRTVNYWTVKKNFPHTKTLGGHCRFDLIEVMRWYKESNQTVPQLLVDACE